jgi:hypothetical protein
MQEFYSEAMNICNEKNCSLSDILEAAKIKKFSYDFMEKGTLSSPGNLDGDDWTAICRLWHEYHKRWMGAESERREIFEEKKDAREEVLEKLLHRGITIERIFEEHDKIVVKDWAKDVILHTYYI